MQERRAFPRYKVRIGGKLIAPDMSTCIEVAIHDLSEDGALVTSKVPAQMPERVYLLEAHAGTIFECTIKWRKREKLFGLHFPDATGRARRRALIAAANRSSCEEPFRISVAPRPRMAIAAGEQTSRVARMPQPNA